MQLVFNFLKNKYIILIFILLFTITFTIKAFAKIKVIVNEDIITEYDIKNRLNYILKILKKSLINNNTNSIRTKIIENLILEKIKIRIAINSGIVLDINEINKKLNIFAIHNNMDIIQLSKFFKFHNSNIITLKNILKSNILWNFFINQKFNSLIHINKKEINEIINKTNKKEIVYDLQYIVLKLPSNSNKIKFAKRLLDAKVIRKKFIKCSRIRTLTSNFGHVKIKSKLNIPLKSLSLNDRDLIKNTKVGSITKAYIINGGIKMIAICKKNISYDKSFKKYIKNKVIKTSFNNFANNYLKELRNQSYVVYK